MVLDSSGNLGLGVTPSAWGFGGVLQIGAYGTSLSSVSGTDLTFAAYYSGGWKYQNASYNPTWYSQASGQHRWYTAPSGTAGSAISFTQAMTLDASGNLLVGTTSAGGVGITAYASGIVRANTNGTTFGQYQYASSMMGTITTDGINIAYNATNAFVFGAGGSERARIDSSGRLLVGTTSASGSDLLQVNSDALINGLTVGRGAGSVSTNTAVGASALASNTSGAYNTAVGYQALSVNTTGSINAAFGQGALQNNNNGYNNAFGVNALNSNTSGYQNSAFGSAALVGNTTGTFNVAIGNSALYSNTTASNNTAVGYQAGYSNTTGATNAFIGQAAGYSNTSGSNNTYLGQGAGYGNQTGSGNIAVGLTALNSATGDTNTAVGFRAGYSQTSGASNTYIGQFAGYSMTTGAKNTILGSYNGNQGGLDIRTSSNYIVLSDGDGNPRGIFDSSGNLLVGTTSQLSGARLSIADATAKTSAATNTTFGTATGGANDFQLIVQRSASGTGAYWALQSVEQSIAYRDIVFQPNGGNIMVGQTSFLNAGVSGSATVASPTFVLGGQTSDSMYSRRWGAGVYQSQTYNGGNSGSYQLQPYGGQVIIGGNGNTTTNVFEVQGVSGQLFSVADSMSGTIFSVNDMSGVPSIEILDVGLVKLAQYNGAVAISTSTAQAAQGLTVNTNTYITSLGVGTVAGGTLGAINATNEITAYYSDRRLKENVKVIDSAVTKVLSLNGITYTPNDLAASFGYDKTVKLVGLFADEVEAVLPEATRPAPFDIDANGNSKSGENYKTIQYEKLVPLLIEAIKEQQQAINDLREELAQLKNKG
jgi:hypothetical protein